MNEDKVRRLIFGYFNYCMDKFDGNASEEAIDLFIEEYFIDKKINEAIDRLYSGIDDSLYNRNEAIKILNKLVNGA